MVERTEILGVEFDNVTLDEAADRAIALMDQDGPHLVATPNPEIVQLARRDRSLAGCYQTRTWSSRTG